MQEHPLTSFPVFFIHPCQTVAVLEASVDRDITPTQYLKLWIGAMGGYVGLTLPVALPKLDFAHGKDKLTEEPANRCIAV